MKDDSKESSFCVYKGDADMFSVRDLLKLILPMILQQMLAIFVGTADSMMVSRAGEAAVSGVSLVGELDALLVIVFSSMVTGGTVSVSHALGRGDKEYGRECAKQLIWFSTGLALIISVFVAIVRPNLLNLLYGSAEEAVLSSANDYLAIMLWTFPLVAINNSGFAIFRTMGDTVISLKLSVLENIINICLNAVFIFRCGMGAAGAALASMIARAVTTVFIMIKLHDRRNDIYIEKLNKFRPDPQILKSIMSVGVPHGIENSMFQFGRLATQMLISTMGTVGIAANTVANTLANFLYLPSSAISNAQITVVGRCYGAGEYGQAKKYARILLFWEYICMWGVSALLCVFGGALIGIYNLSDAGAELALKLTLFHCVCTSLVRPLAFNLPSVFKAAGDSKYSMAVSTVSMWVVRVGLAYLLAPESIRIFGTEIPCMGLGIFGVWVAMMGDWVVRAALFLIRFLRGTWLGKKEK